MRDRTPLRGITIRSAVRTQPTSQLTTTLPSRAQVTIAYEPVWAIGTGLTCAPDQAQKVRGPASGPTCSGCHCSRLG